MDTPTEIQHPLLNTLPADVYKQVVALAKPRTLPAGQVLFYPGEAVSEWLLLVQGKVGLAHGRDPQDLLSAGSLLDEAALLGGLPHRHKAEVIEEVTVLAWPAEALWQIEGFANAARAYLARQLLAEQSRRQALEAPLHYRDGRVGLMPPPFHFDNVTLIFAFCEAERAVLDGLLPPALSLLGRPGRKNGTVLLALADFPTCYPDQAPAATFGYTETIVFLPVRYKSAWGLYVPYIFSSAWEPILLGREIYGFPKRLGRTEFEGRQVRVSVDGRPLCHFEWQGAEAASEAQLVGAFSEAMGIMGQVTTLAFQAGEVLRRIARLPAHRRVDVYNWRQMLAPPATVQNMQVEVNQLTRATFGVMSWIQIAQLRYPHLLLQGEPLAGLGLYLRSAYRTQLNMRLSAGRVVEDFDAPAS